MTDDKAVTIRLSSSVLKTIDELTEYFRRKELARRESADIPSPGRLPTRSDMIRVCITGYLMDHNEALVSFLEELDEQA